MRLVVTTALHPEPGEHRRCRVARESGRQRQALTARVRGIAARKRAAVERGGLKEGRDFWVNPEHGKIYSAMRATLLAFEERKP